MAVDFFNDSFQFFGFRWVPLVMEPTVILTVKAKAFHRMDDEHIPDCYLMGIPLLKNKMIK